MSSGCETTANASYVLETAEGAKVFTSSTNEQGHNHVNNNVIYAHALKG